MSGKSDKAIPDMAITLLPQNERRSKESPGERIVAPGRKIIYYKIESAVKRL